ncbi:MAG: hypothetical protein NUW37_15245 [Planctomycetes bacterium]|nr:hypothetical protein [Planctomycetota bacterium]
MSHATGRFALIASLILLAVSLALDSCSRENPQPADEVRFNPDDPAPERLSAFNLFDGSPHKPRKNVLYYDLATPLFSDYAVKYRHVWMPEGKSAKYMPELPFDFPVGTIIAKTFAFPLDFRNPSKGERIIETRLLILRPGGWDVLPYIWNEAQTDATLKKTGLITNVSFIDANGETNNINYIVPNTNQCKACHDAHGKFGPIGPVARQLNNTIKYPDGAEANQLSKWIDSGILSDVPEIATIDSIPAWDDENSGTIAERARAYLEINCAHCHNPAGPGRTAGLDLRYSQVDPYKFGVRRNSVSAGPATGGFLHDIEPGNPAESIIVHRMSSTELGTMMPELGRTTVHKEAVELVSSWIAEMNPSGTGGD